MAKAPVLSQAPSSTRNRVLTAAVLIPIILALVLGAPRVLFEVVVVLVALLTLREYLDLAGKAGQAPLRALSFVAVVALVVWPPGAGTVVPLLVMLALALVLRPPRSLDKVLPGAAATVLGILYVGLPMALLADLRRLPDGPQWVLYVLLLIWVSDTAAYFVGRVAGRHRMAPQISPGKTWEGALASLAAGVAFGILYPVLMARVGEAGITASHSLSDLSYAWSATTALLVNVAGQIGDLVESGLKRSAGVKDSSSILPGHGGLLDRVDALLFAVPTLWYILSLRSPRLLLALQ